MSIKRIDSYGSHDKGVTINVDEETILITEKDLQKILIVSSGTFKTITTGTLFLQSAFRIMMKTEKGKKELKSNLEAMSKAI